MKHIMRPIAILLFLMIGSNVQAGLMGPDPYSSFNNSPFFSTDFSSGYWHLEDFEDGLFNVPGVTATGSGLCITGSECFTAPGDTIRDSVDGVATNSHFANPGSTGITYTFDAVALGALPTHVGIVWTDGAGSITFEAFDNLNNSLGTIVGTHADTSVNGTTGEDRFYGADLSGLIGVTGFSSISISNASGGIEVDHLQFGCNLVACGSGPGPIKPVPEPSIIALFAAGLFGLGLARRKKRS